GSHPTVVDGVGSGQSQIAFGPAGLGPQSVPVAIVVHGLGEGFQYLDDRRDDAHVGCHLGSIRGNIQQACVRVESLLDSLRNQTAELGQSVPGSEQSAFGSVESLPAVRPDPFGSSYGLARLALFGDCRSCC
ncbi:MAG TPA: hypothetical protein VIQ02_20965, partial [Jiangellaceae bacterium]